jgi:methyl-accepting chemotaxis protein
MTEIYETENAHLHSINKLASYSLLAHIPVAIALAMTFNTGIAMALIVSLGICSLPLFLTFFTKSHKFASITHGIALMFYSALLIHLSKGMIEVHFHIFVSLAIMIVFANPWVILAAAATIAVHHISFFFLLPESVFNYKASIGILLVHAGFVIVQTIPCMWIANKFKSYIVEQGATVAQISDIFLTMNQNIESLFNNNQLLSQGSELQISAVTETAETIHQISSMAAQTSENASQSKSISEKTQGSAEIGLKIVEQVTQAIQKIKNSNDSVMEHIDQNRNQLSEIVQTIRQIEGKTNIINDIVFQTKLLSFNASVEAARAGEHGKGFAVVAEEIGNLATTSGKASKEINDLINTSVHKVQTMATSTETKMSELMKTSHACISEGESKVKVCGETFEELTSYIKDLNGRVNGISVANEEQSQGVSEMTKAIKQLEESNLKNFETLKTSVEVSETLSTLSNNLGDLVSKLNSKNAA